MKHSGPVYTSLCTTRASVFLFRLLRLLNNEGPHVISRLLVVVAMTTITERELQHTHTHTRDICYYIHSDVTFSSLQYIHIICIYRCRLSTACEVEMVLKSPNAQNVFQHVKHVYIYTETSVSIHTVPCLTSSTYNSILSRPSPSAPDPDPQCQTCVPPSSRSACACGSREVVAVWSASELRCTETREGRAVQRGRGRRERVPATGRERAR